MVSIVAAVVEPIGVRVIPAADATRASRRPLHATTDGSNASIAAGSVRSAAKAAAVPPAAAICSTTSAAPVAEAW